MIEALSPTSNQPPEADDREDILISGLLGTTAELGEVQICVCALSVASNSNFYDRAEQYFNVGLPQGSDLSPLGDNFIHFRTGGTDGAPPRRDTPLASRREEIHGSHLKD